MQNCQTLSFSGLVNKWKYFACIKSGVHKTVLFQNHFPPVKRCQTAVEVCYFKEKVTMRLVFFRAFLHFISCAIKH